MEVALRMQRLELELIAVKKDLNTNTEATRELLAAWNTSTGSLSFIKGCAIFGASVAGIYVAASKIWGH